MSEMDVLQFEDKKFNELSGGEKQRVKIAAALAQQPEILLLDEPTSQLDMGHGIHLMQHLKRLNAEQNISIMLVSHDIQLIAGFMQEFILLKDGKIIASGDAESVLQPKLIEEAYDCKVDIIKSKTGKIQIIPE
jgi:cobalamin transport system ATP-binding protein